MKILYIPIEIGVRELSSRCSIALGALTKGFDKIIIGKQSELFIRSNAKGCYLLKSAASMQEDLIEDLYSSGHKVFSIDEEGILPHSSSNSHRITRNNIDKFTAIFCNGFLEIDSLKEEIVSSSKLMHTGNPRFDFYNTDGRNFFITEKQKIKSRFKKDRKLILIVSRFGDVNPSSCKSTIDQYKDMGIINSPKELDLNKGFIEHGIKIFKSMLLMVETISKEFIDCEIVVRPHPNELVSAWTHLECLPNVSICAEYEIGAWLSSSNVMIHNGCTTSLESSAIGCPIISYMPFQDSKFDLEKANALGLPAYTINNVSENLEIIFSNKYSILEEREKLKKYLFLSEQGSIYSSISNILFDNAIASEKSQPFLGHLFNMYSFYKKEVAKYLLFIFNLRYDNGRHKYGRTTSKQFKELVRKVGEFHNLGNFKVRRSGIDIYEIKLK